LGNISLYNWNFIFFKLFKLLKSIIEEKISEKYKYSRWGNFNNELEISSYSKINFFMDNAVSELIYIFSHLSMSKDLLFLFLIQIYF